MRKIRKMILKLLMPLIKWMGGVSSFWSMKRITEKSLADYKLIAKKGDYFLTDTYGELSNLFNSSEVNHGAWYLGDGKVIEAVGAGVRTVSLEWFFYTKDYIKVVELKAMDDILFETMKRHALLFIGRPYDLWFNFRNKDVYCFELLKLITEQSASIKLKTKKTMGVRVVLSDAFTDERYFAVRAEYK